MLDLLQAPTSQADFQGQFMEAYEDALRHAYPLTRALIAEHHAQAGTTRDYTLACIDLGQVRAIEDEALTDHSLATFVRDMLARLQGRTKLPRHEILRQVFDVYSEALICRLLRERTGGRLRIVKIAETSVPGPDFACEMDVRRDGETRVLRFYIEVKSLDIVAATQRLAEMLDDAMDVQIELDRQVAQGHRIAMAEGEIAPHRPFGGGAGYDAWSVRVAIENVIQKAASNFKNAQFQRGPTFALANLLRLPIPGQGVGTLAPSYRDPRQGNAEISGALWNVAFGALGRPIQRAPEFEGADGADGHLTRGGLLVDPAVGLHTPGLIALHYDQGAYRFDGLYDAKWAVAEWDWTPAETVEVVRALCGDYNDGSNARGQHYEIYQKRTH
jgi:hypothetical protein